ncbi:hypothetical protein DFP72DRAFT_831912 [Ephemerocybe angulata]|uniref:Uncharacterized protein n=1 Tax=Ephemerocybe angulata TaxID=980116 RepID=A0A8H6H8N3_9AGAR|nr:hypothetical protein DFP72DRAFT_831912 [Tulosesus angulatus]
MASSPRQTFHRSASASSSSSSIDAADWDTSVTMSDTPRLTPRNSVLFPQEVNQGGLEESTPRRKETSQRSIGKGEGGRTLSDLLKLHAEKGTRCAFTQEEARRVGDVLGQWINSSSSPYEGEEDSFDDFVSVRGKDDLYIPNRRIEALSEGRARGMSESSSRPGSSAAGQFPSSSSTTSTTTTATST